LRSTFKRFTVTGAGGFIGHHLVKRLKAEGHWVRGVDIKRPEYEPSPADEFELLDLRMPANCILACRGQIDCVCHLAADMGGIGYISRLHASITHNNLLMDTHMLEAAREVDIPVFFYSSSACVYSQSKQRSADVSPLKEEDAHPAEPEPGYGWEKLMAEKLCSYYHEDFGLDTCVARFHNVYGPLGTFDGGKEKAPASICRKVAQAKEGGEIEVWGDGKQTRSFMFIDDCVEGIVRLLKTHTESPVNLGSEELVSIDELVDIVCDIAGKRLHKRHILGEPQGVRGRNSDNSHIRSLLGWEPRTALRQGLATTYAWIEDQVRKCGPLQPRIHRGPGQLASSR
jgi:GDP-D-mannose 3',5'-epimerase